MAAYCAKEAISCEAIDVFVENPKTADGQDFKKINRKGNIPCLVFDDGVSVLSEETTILAYLADRSKGLIAPLPGSLARYKVDQIVSCIASNVNVNIDELRVPNVAEDIRNVFKNHLNQALAVLDHDLANPERRFVAGQKLTIADIYLHAVLNRLALIEVDLHSLSMPFLVKYFDGIANHEDIKGAMARMNIAPGTTCVLDHSEVTKCSWLC